MYNFMYVNINLHTLKSIALKLHCSTVCTMHLIVRKVQAIKLLVFGLL